jgi:hypothetical protein
MAIRAELHLGIRDFQGNLKRATADVKREADAMKKESGGVGGTLASGIKGAMPALGFGVIMSGIKALIDRAGDIDDLAIKLGETADAVQRVDHAAKIAGSGGVDQVGNAMIRLEKNLGAVGNERATAALERLGLSAGTLMGMPLDEKILALSEAFQTARAEGTAVPDLLDLVGKSGAELIPMLSMAREELEGLFANAPALTQAQIVEMTKVGDAVDTAAAKMKNFASGAVAGGMGIGQFIGDLVSTGSLEEAQTRMVDRDTAVTKSVYDRMDGKTAQGEAVAEQQAAAEAAAEEAAAADELAKALERVAKIKESIAAKEMESMSGTEQVEELKRQQQALLAGTIGNFYTFDQSTEGLRALAESREKTPGLPNEGMNSAAEAWEWYQQSLELSEKQRILETSLAKEEADAAKKRADDLAAARAEAEAGGFALMTDEEQVADLKSRLGKALGIDVSSTGSIDGAIARQRKEVEDARTSGDTEAERAALDRLNESQRLASEFYAAADSLAPDAPAGGVGSVAGLMNQVFGRDPQAQQLDELKRSGDLARDQRDRLDIIIGKMDDPPEPVTFGGF